MKSVEDLAQKIVVQASQAAHVDLRLERGATLSGSVRYDDGSPAPGVTPILMEQQTDGKWKELSTSLLPSTTDDRGHYRFYGLAPGKYAVKATLPTIQASTGLGTGPGMVSLHMNTGDALVVYSGGALREKDVKPVEVGKGDDTDGIDVIFPLSDLHVVSGTVVAKSMATPSIPETYPFSTPRPRLKCAPPWLTATAISASTTFPMASMCSRSAARPTWRHLPAANPRTIWRA